MISSLSIVQIRRVCLIFGVAMATWQIQISDSMADDDQVFSGPQKGEKLGQFQAQHLLSDEADLKFDLIKSADGGRVLLIFIHELTRPSLGLARAVSEYAVKDREKKMKAAIIFLTSDVTETKTWANRAKRALPKNVLLGVYDKGEEGPGSYGLNRKMTVTVLIGNDNKVVENYALVQPSLNSDVLNITKAIAKLVDEKPPTLAELGLSRLDLRRWLAPVIQKAATEAEVDAAAKRVEAEAAKNRPLRTRIYEVTNRIINAGKLENYGTEHAQKYFKKWAKEFAPKKQKSKSKRAFEADKKSDSDK